jgi:hypothetical protein
MISKIRAIVAKLWSNSLVECYGSYATSLCIPSSDLDLVVLLSAASTLLCGYKSVETNKYRKAPIPAALAFGCPDHLSVRRTYVVRSAGSNDNLLRRDWTHMQILVEELRKHDWVHSLQFIDTAKVRARVATPHCIVCDKVV